MFFSANAGKRSLALDLKAPARPRGAAAAGGRRRRRRSEPPAGDGGAARVRAGRAARAQPAPRLRDDRRVRADRPARRRARLRPADAGRRRDHERHRRERPAARARRRLADRHRHRRLGGAGDRRRAARGTGPHARPLALRDGALARLRTSSSDVLAGGAPAGTARHRLPADRPVPGVRDAPTAS